MSTEHGIFYFNPVMLKATSTDAFIGCLKVINTLFMGFRTLFSLLGLGLGFIWLNIGRPVDNRQCTVHEREGKVAHHGPRDLTGGL